MGAVATTHKQKYREPFGPVMGGVEFVRFNDVADLRAKFNDAQAEPVCAICIEAVQGEGGVRPVSKEFFAAARELCDSTGALLLADEIQSGHGAHGRVVRLPALRDSAGHYDRGQADGEWAADGRDAVHGRGRARLHAGDARERPSAAGRCCARSPSR